MAEEKRIEMISRANSLTTICCCLGGGSISMGEKLAARDTVPSNGTG